MAKSNIDSSMKSSLVFVCFEIPSSLTTTAVGVVTLARADPKRVGSIEAESF